MAVESEGVTVSKARRACPLAVARIYRKASETLSTQNKFRYEIWDETKSKKTPSKNYMIVRRAKCSVYSFLMPSALGDLDSNSNLWPRVFASDVHNPPIRPHPPRFSAIGRSQLVSFSQTFGI